MIAIICVIAFFAYEFVPSQSEKFLKAKNTHIQAKKNRSKALNSLKENAKGTALYDTYYAEKLKTDEAWENLTDIVEKERFIGFDNFQQFLGEFGWSFGLLLYSLFNFITVRMRDSIYQKGESILHSILIFISLYYIGWCFNFTQDFSKSIYVAACLLSTLAILFATRILIKTKVRHFESLMHNIKDLIGFMFSNTKAESEDKMWDVLNDIEHGRK